MPVALLNDKLTVMLEEEGEKEKVLSLCAAKLECAPTKIPGIEIVVEPSEPAETKNDVEFGPGV